jgi:hypothetical protein
MSFGLDYVTGPPISTMKAAGVTFVCRYLSFVNSLTQVKLLSLNEAKTLGQAGIAIVSNYEWYANRALESFASGVVDAQIAAAQHANCGGPVDRPIYFSVDCDCDASQTFGYFKGVASVIGLHRTGAYGSFRVLQGLFNAGLITWGWQTYAWSYGQWEPRAHIQQYSNGMTMAGLSVDYDRAIKSDFGQWLYGSTPSINQGDLQLLQLSDPMGKFFVDKSAPNAPRWHCVHTNVDIAYAHLSFYRKYEGIFGLPLTGEIYLASLPGTAIQVYERVIAIYDPKKTVDNPPGAGSVYLLHIDSGVGQEIVAKPLVTELNNQIAALKAQIASNPDVTALQSKLAALQAGLHTLENSIISLEKA